MFDPKIVDIGDVDDFGYRLEQSERDWTNVILLLSSTLKRRRKKVFCNNLYILRGG